MALRVYSSLSRRSETITPRRDDVVRVYCCGPTTYDVSHAGHGRSALLPDVLVRHLRASGRAVKYVRNITDVDDKILKRAKERGEDPLELSARFARAYDEDLARLSCIVPDATPKVSETLPEICELIARLVSVGAAYVADGEHGRDVWYAVRSFAGYGRLSGRSLEELRAGEGLEERGKAQKEGKRDPLDFALWKSAPADEWGFDSPWGHGRPGWHIECSAMVEKHLGFGIDVHCGGMDLVFPHHENEIAQSEAARPGEGDFASVWMHNGFLNVDKEKMAKSLGNFVTMRDCFERNDPEALRMFYLSAQPRGPLEFDTEKLEDGRVVFPGLDEAEAKVDDLYAAKVRLLALATTEGDAPPSKDLASFAGIIDAARGKVAEALDEDLNTPVALAHLFELVKAANGLCDLAEKRKKDAGLRAAAGVLARRALAALDSSAGVLGLVASEPGEYAARTTAQRLSFLGLTAADLDARIDERRLAREARDFARGDAIRDELVAIGVEVLDTPAGTSWHVRARRPRRGS